MCRAGSTRDTSQIKIHRFSLIPTKPDQKLSKLGFDSTKLPKIIFENFYFFDFLVYFLSQIGFNWRHWLNSYRPVSVNTPGGTVSSLHFLIEKWGLFFSFQTNHKTVMMVLWRTARTIRVNSERFRIFTFLSSIVIFGRKIKTQFLRFLRKFVQIIPKILKKFGFFGSEMGRISRVFDRPYFFLGPRPPNLRF